jgi:hypothetical protein
MDETIIHQISIWDSECEDKRVKFIHPSSTFMEDLQNKYRQSFLWRFENGQIQIDSGKSRRILADLEVCIQQLIEVAIKCDRTFCGTLNFTRSSDTRPCHGIVYFFGRSARIYEFDTRQTIKEPEQSRPIIKNVCVEVPLGPSPKLIHLPEPPLKVDSKPFKTNQHPQGLVGQTVGRPSGLVGETVRQPKAFDFCFSEQTCTIFTKEYCLLLALAVLEIQPEASLGIVLTHPESEHIVHVVVTWPHVPNFQDMCLDIFGWLPRLEVLEWWGQDYDGLVMLPVEQCNNPMVKSAIQMDLNVENNRAQIQRVSRGINVDFLIGRTKLAKSVALDMVDMLKFCHPSLFEPTIK